MDRAPLDVDALRRSLDDRWARIDVVEQTGSTNADLLQDTGAADRTALLAEDQTAGRGRLDRSWASPPRAGLIVSVALRPRTPPATWAWLPLLTGVALREAVAAATAVPTELKWPNDLMHAERGKLAGILAQSADSLVVVGVGLNVSTTRDELPVDTATSLTLCGADAPDRTELGVAYLRRLDSWVARWSDVDGDAAACGLLAEYRAACATLGRAVRVTSTDGSAMNGQAVDVDSLGRLLVDASGRLHTVGAGDVHHLRALP